MMTTPQLALPVSWGGHQVFVCRLESNPTASLGRVEKGDGHGRQGLASAGRLRGREGADPQIKSCFDHRSLKKILKSPNKIKHSYLGSPIPPHLHALTPLN